MAVRKIMQRHGLMEGWHGSIKYQGNFSKGRRNGLENGYFFRELCLAQ